MRISDENAESLRTRLTDRYDFAYQGLANYLEEARMDLEFYLGAQWSAKAAGDAQQVGRALYVFNKIRRQVNLMAGYEIRNRHILKVAPIERSDDIPAGEHTSVIMQQMSNQGGYDMMSDAFLWGPLTTGSNLMVPYRDRNGTIRFGRHGYNQFLFDPTTCRVDWEDCDFYLTGRYLSDADARFLLPEASEKISRVQPGNSHPRWNIGANFHFRYGEKTRLFEELWEKEIGFQEILYEKQTGREVPFEDFVDLHYGGDTRRARYVVENLKNPNNGSPMLGTYRRPKNQITVTYFVDGEPVWSGDNPLGIDEFNAVWMVGEFCPEMDRDELKIQGFSRPLRDPQTARNRRLNQVIDIMETQISTLRLVKDKFIVNKEAVFASGQKGPVFISDDWPDQLPLENVFRQTPAPGIQPGMFQLLEVLEKEDIQATGMNEEIFGSDDTDRPVGMIHRFRTGQALTAQQSKFANFRRAKALLGRKLVKINGHLDPDGIPDNLSRLRAARILSRWPSPQFYAEDFSQYDCVPTEGLLTDTQQQLWYEELKSLRETFPDAAQYITVRMLLENAPVQNKKELLDAVDRAEQQVRAQGQAMAQQQQMLNRVAQARAEEDLSDARLNRIKGLAEIQDMRLKARREGNEAGMSMLERLVQIEQMLGLLPVTPSANPRNAGNGQLARTG